MPVVTNALNRTARFGAALTLTFSLAAPFAQAADNNMPTPHEYAVPSDMANKALLLDVVENGNRLVAVGEYGHILLSDDRGDSWQQAASVPTRNTLTSVIFLDNQIGYAVGHEATILQTTDGGNNWTMQYNERRGEDPLFGVYFSDAKNGIAVGGFSKVFATNDGGKTWAPRTLVEDSYDDFHLNDIIADTKGNLYIPAEFGTVYKSRDRGQTWAALETGYDGSFWGGLGLANGDVLVHGMRGNAYTSSDNGKSWTSIETGSDQSITGGVQLEDGRIVLSGLSGAVLVSIDNAKSFSFTSRPDRLSFSTVGRGKNDTVLLFGDPGVKTHNLK